MGQTQQIEVLKSQRKGSRQKHTNLRKRVGVLLDCLKKHVEPTLQTTRKARYDEAADPVKSLLKRK